MNAIYRRRLLKLAKYLAGPVAKADAAARKKGRFKFYMNDWSTWNSAEDWEKNTDCPMRVGLSKNMCNTAACALGWATNVFRELRFNKEGDGVVMGRGNNKRYNSEIAEVFFGLNPEQAELVFYDSTNSPKDKAKQIRDIVK